MPAARIGDITAHGGVIVVGCPTVIIGEVGMGSPGVPDVGATVASAIDNSGDTTFSDDTDATMMAATMKEAARSGVPFCDH
jgi:hypothetical protein